ncbi:hypothetical protein C1645_821107 [Glomus cerebriforme]|uniref:Uncharacterized protein n=1 Tax=Glomus cerebriforme TaxID=658196 RepID=A0A397T6Z5_9GLOM|nr:hypothetical protein C1645_821107 [Glomus cerebriforme]
MKNDERHEKLFKAKKEIVVIAKIASMKQKTNKKKKRKKEALESDNDFDDSLLNDNISKKKANSIPKVSGLISHQKAIGKLVTEFREQWHCP